MGFGRVLICLVTSFVFLSGCGTIQPTQSIPNNMVFVSGGTYIMASNRSAFEDELPHIVKLSDFYYRSLKRRLESGASLWQIPDTSAQPRNCITPLCLIHGSFPGKSASMPAGRM